jgi:hypothetical protein
MMFRIGQKVVCIDDSIEHDEPGPHTVKGRIYTISSMPLWENEPTLLFEELPPHWDPNWSTGYNPECFRPIVETDISVFTAMLKPVKVEA